MSGKKTGGATIVIKKVEEVAGGHHGGAWKVAYADFVTAMMAFFLLMWLLNATTEEQRNGIANYFSPTNVFGSSNSGSGQPFGGRSPMHDESLVGQSGSPTVEQQDRSSPRAEDEAEDMAEPHSQRFVDGGARPSPYAIGGHYQDPRTAGAGGEQAAELTAEEIAAAAAARAAADQEAEQAELEQRAAEEQAAAEQQSLEKTAEQLRAALLEDPRLVELASQVSIEVTPEGLEVQLLDAEARAMFASGSSRPSDAVRALVRRLAPVLGGLPNPIAVAGHTDAAPFRPGSAITNWELSAERANTTRRLLVESGVPEARISRVAGLADRQLKLPSEPTSAANRRIAILVQRTVEVPPPPARQAAVTPPAASVRVPEPRPRSSRQAPAETLATPPGAPIPVFRPALR